MTSTATRAEQIERLEQSGWNACPSIRDGLQAAGLPAPTAAYLRRAISTAEWDWAAHALELLRSRFAGERFGDSVSFGILLVPDPAKLDTRAAIAPTIRADQFGALSDDFFDARLPAGALVVEPGRDWTPVATVTGTEGISMGSYDDVRSQPEEDFTLEGVDTRAYMVRQLWGARVLQCGATLPDSNARDRWTFTIHAGENLVAGQAESGTVLHGCVRFRLGRSDRRIASGRVCPAIVIS